MAVRLSAMRRVLKPTGSIFLHCDPTASHYLKLIMDAIFDRRNFRNEIVWCYTGPGSPKMRQFNRKHDIIFWYNAGDQWVFNKSDVRIPHKDGGPHAGGFKGGRTEPDDPRYGEMGKIPETWWPFAIAARSPTQYLGYPTQKPLALLERIIMASSPPEGLVLDPFCGCGTAVHAAENLGRSWIGIDISAFATGLVRERILHNFPTLTTDDVLVRGLPVNVVEAMQLAQRDKFEFEKWVCGAIGAEGMFHEPGTKGADGGVDGVLKFYPFRLGVKPIPEYAIIQVKGGNVTPDAVRALKTTVDHFGATAGVMVCFARQMGTVENQRSKATFRDDSDTYPVIQGLSIEDLLAGKPLQLPLYGYRRRGGQIGDFAELLESRNTRNRRG